MTVIADFSDVAISTLDPGERVSSPLAAGRDIELSEPELHRRLRSLAQAHSTAEGAADWRIIQRELGEITGVQLTRSEVEDQLHRVDRRQAHGQPALEQSSLQDFTSTVTGEMTSRRAHFKDDDIPAGTFHGGDDIPPGMFC